MGTVQHIDMFIYTHFYLQLKFFPSLLLSRSACTGEHALGLESGLVTDQQMSASSFSVNHEPSQGRLNLRVGRGKKGAWCSRTKDQNQYLQVDFWRNVKITKVATQGRQDYDQWGNPIQAFLRCGWFYRFPDISGDGCR